MTPIKVHIPNDISELLTLLGWISVKAPKFTDRTGYLPGVTLDSAFHALSGGLSNVRPELDDSAFHRLRLMSEQARALFEADPDDKTGQTLQGRQLILQMEDVVREAPR